MHTLTRLHCLLAAFAAVDGPLMTAQAFAWFLMIQDRCSELGLAGSINDTFSGESPCEICVAIQEERRDERKEAPIPDSSPFPKTAPGLVDSKPISLFPPPRDDLVGAQWRVLDSAVSNQYSVNSVQTSGFSRSEH